MANIVWIGGYQKHINIKKLSDYKTINYNNNKTYHKKYYLKGMQDFYNWPIIKQQVY